MPPVPLSPAIRAHLGPSPFGESGQFRGRVHEIKGWKHWPIARQIGFIRTFIGDSSKDPNLVDLAVKILRQAGVTQRSYAKQWAALLVWVRQHVYYVNERDERLQSPQFTIARGFGDCDDMIILLCALGDSIRLPWRLVISGYTASGQKRRWIEGQGPVPAGVKWSHIYGMGGWPPFKPSQWRFMEPTLDVPFGWDVMSGDREAASGRARPGTRLPEMGGLGSLGNLGGPPPDIARAGVAFWARVRAQNPSGVEWVGFDRGRWLVHQGGCVQTPLQFPTTWAGRPVVRVPGGIAPVRPPGWSWGRSGSFGAATAVPAPKPAAVVVPAGDENWPTAFRFVVKLPWKEIVVATIPTVLSAWAIGRLMGARAAEKGGGRGCVRRAA